MKQKKICITDLRLLIVLFFTGFMFSSCDKNDDESVNWSDIYTTEGYIKYNIKGTTSDSIKIDESFIADKYSKGSIINSNSYWKSPYYNDLISFNIRRSPNKDGSNSINIDFDKNGNDISNVGIDFNFTKVMSNDKILSKQFYYVNDGHSINLKPITDLKFDTLTNELSGKFTFNQYGSTIIVVSGEFKMKLVRRIDF